MKKIYLALFFLLCTRLLSSAQSDSSRLNSIASRVEKLTATHPVEKLYLHLNKPGYNVSDTIWFKAYLTVGPHHQPSALSGVLYIELINSKDKIIQSIKLENNNGVVAGDLPLAEKLMPGNYRLRAYTAWMRNAGNDYFFTKTITIADAKTAAVFVTPTIDMADKNDGQINGKLAYTDKYGRPFDHKQVTYEVQIDTTTIYKGTGVTDESGDLNFSFPAKPVGAQKRLNIVNHVKLVNGIIIDKTVLASLQKEQVDIQFFPEGGQLVSGVRSKVGFKALGTNGLGADVKGVVLDSENKEVAYFSSQHAGMGVFFLIPQPGKTYTAKITLEDKSTITAQLPLVAEKGFVLAVNSADSLMLTVRIATNDATLQEKQHTSFYLVGQSAGTVYYTTLGKLDDKSFSASVPKSKFPNGIAQFTLFSAASEPLNERVVFIQNRDSLLTLDLKTTKPVYGAKEQVSMAFYAQYNNKPVEGNFSLSIFNESKLASNENAESTILSSILLTSDVKGYIEEPGYYFNQLNHDTQANLDILMLTQGYRRFEWKEILSDQYPQINFQPEKSLSISGRLTNGSGKPVVKGRLKVLAPIDKMAADTLTDAEGKFNLTDLDFSDGAKLFIQARKANDGKNVNISLNGRTIPIINKSSIADVSQNSEPPYLSMMVKGTVDSNQVSAEIRTANNNAVKSLKEVNIKDKKTVKPDWYNNYGTAYQYHLDMKQTKEYNSIFEAIRSMVPGVTYANGRLSYEGKRMGPVLVNGLEFEISRLEIIDPVDVESVSITKSGSIPLVLIVTKTYAGTDTVKVATSKMLKEIDVKGRKSGGNGNAPWMAKVTHSANLNGAGNADMIFGAKDLQDCVDFLTCLMTKVFGTTLQNGSYYFTRRISQSVTSPPPIRFMLDGIMLNGTLELETLNAINVSSVEVLNNNSLLSIYGSQASGGLIIVTTKIGTEVNNDALAFESVPGVIYTKFSGFYKTETFYIPKYIPANLRNYDPRTAIYWNPNIITDSKGNLPIEYFNSDVKGTYRAVIEGIDNNGNIGRYVYRYKVE